MSSTQPNQKPHVLILGAGIGGLTLAQSLRNKGVPFTVIERDKRIDSRSQGWAIGIHSIIDDIGDSFSKDLPSIDVTSHLYPLDIPAQICFYNDGKKFSVESTPSHKIIRANRQKLRQWLATNIDIQWNKHLTKIEETKENVKLVFADGSTMTGDVLIGADGAHSVVRSHIVPDIPLQRVAISTIIGEPVLDNASFQRQLALGHSAYINSGSNYQSFIGLNSIAKDASSANYYWLLTQPDSDGSKTKWHEQASQQEQLDFALKSTQDLEPQFSEIYRQTKREDIREAPLTFWEVEIERIPRGKISMLGDAAHCMTPFRGEGGVQAMRDALNLARALASTAIDNIPDTLKQYEAEMLPRGLESLRNSRAAGDHNEGAARVSWGVTVTEVKDE